MKKVERSKLIIVAAAIDNCEGILIPYPTAKKMAEVSADLKNFLSTDNEEKERPPRPR